MNGIVLHKDCDRQQDEDYVLYKSVYKFLSLLYEFSLSVVYVLYKYCISDLYELYKVEMLWR